MNDNKNKGRKIALFVCHELLGLLMLNQVIPALTKIGLEPVIFNATTKWNRKLKVPYPKIVEAMNVHVLKGVIIPFIEERQREDHAPNLTYSRLAEKHGIEYHEIDDINDPALVQRLAEDDGFVGAVSMRLMLIFEKPIIDVFRAKGFMWNLHSGLLPDYRGILIPYRAIENGEKEYGLTLHEMAVGIDEGAILSTGVLPLNPQRPVLDLYLDTVDTAVDMVITALSQVARGDIPKGTPQQGPGRYYSNPTPEEFMRAMQRGILYIDPDTTLRRIADAFAGPGTAQSDALCARMASFLGNATHTQDAAQTAA